MHAFFTALRQQALAMPEAYEEFPWDHSVAKVRKKVFIFMPGPELDGDSGQFSVKLPHSADLALSLPGVEPTGYGLGRSGWVSVRVTEEQVPPLDLVQAWLDESYRCIAPKKLVALLER